MAEGDSVGKKNWVLGNSVVLVGWDDVKDGQTGGSPRTVSRSRSKTREEAGGSVDTKPIGRAGFEQTE